MKKPERPAILFVCKANIIRSPMAEVILKAKMRRSAAFNGWQVGSAGVFGLTGEPADPRAQRAVLELGMDLSQHVARRITEDLAAENDLILTMEKDQKESLHAAYPALKEKIFFLGEFTGIKADIFDPISGGYEDFRATAQELNRWIGLGFLRIVVQALQNSLGVLDPLPLGELESGSLAGAELAAVLKAVADRPPAVRYEILRLLLQLFPGAEPVLQEITQVARQTPPSAEEEQWLLQMRLREIVQPITCLQILREPAFRHPEIQAKLEQIRQRLEKPELQDLFNDLEKLSARNLPPFKYRLGIWDLKAKYSDLPYRIGDYEEAYRILRQM